MRETCWKKVYQQCLWLFLIFLIALVGSSFRNWYPNQQMGSFIVLKMDFIFLHREIVHHIP